LRKLLFCIALMGQLFTLQAEGDIPKEEVFPVATIVKIEGKAKILPVYSIKKHTAKIGEGLLKGDKLITYADTKVLIKLLDDSKIVLNENVEMILSSDSTIAQKSGEVYYKINRRSKRLGLKVETPFSIIGIKGTEFIVNFENAGQIALNEGLVGVTSPDAAFELYQEQELSDFEKYQREQDEGFEAYKRETEDRIAAYVQSFDLEANKMLTFSSSTNCKEACEKQVVEVEFTKEMMESFRTYQEMIGN